MLRCSRGRSRIELLEPSEPIPSIAKFIEKRGEGLHHVALKVPDLRAAVERLKRAGARLLERAAPRRGRTPIRFCASRLHRRRPIELIQESET